MNSEAVYLKAERIGGPPVELRGSVALHRAAQAVAFELHADGDGHVTYRNYRKLTAAEKQLCRRIATAAVRAAMPHLATEADALRDRLADLVWAIEQGLDLEASNEFHRARAMVRSLKGKG